MFVWDVETLDIESTAVVLSIGAVYHDGVSEVSYQKLIDTGVFVKFSANDQIVNYKRTRNKETLDWWAKQSPEAKRASVVPSEDDYDAVTGLKILRTWFQSFPDWKNEIVWARGTLDQLCTESLTRAAGTEQIAPYASWRDVRTGIEMLYPTTRNGYVDVDNTKVKDYSRTNVIRHHPLHDCAEDMCMLLGGKVE